MQQHRFVSIKEMIAKVYEDLNTQLELRHGAIITWIGEALEFIGATAQYIKRLETLKIKEFEAVLPCDFYMVEQISYKGIHLIGANQTVAPHIRKADRLELRDRQYRNTKSYYIVGDKVVFGIRDGEAQLYYYAIQLDADGYPMIPDMIEYKDALLKYVIMKSKFAEYNSGRVSFAEYDAMSREWILARDRASACISMPTVDEMISYGKTYQRFIPLLLDHEQGYRNNNIQQHSI